MSADRTRVTLGRRAAPVLAGLLVAAAVVVLAFPYLSARETSLGSNAGTTNPAQALDDLATAAKLNPLNSDPGRVAGTIALRIGENRVAEQRFEQSIQREPGGWFSWLGAGLAASALGQRTSAHHDYEIADSINDQEPAVRLALARVGGPHPLTSGQAFKLLILLN